MNKTVSDAEDAEKKARDRHNELHQRWNTAKTHIESLKKRIDQREPELRKLEIEFSTALAPAGFSDEVQFLEARLTAEQRDELSTKAKKLDDNQTDLKARQKIEKHVWPQKLPKWLPTNLLRRWNRNSKSTKIL